MNESYMQHLYQLSENIGERPHGSKANKTATEYIYNTLEKTGLSVERLPYPSLGWHLSIAEAFASKKPGCPQSRYLRAL
jgi:hypothetical protein